MTLVQSSEDNALQRKTKSKPYKSISTAFRRTITADSASPETKHFVTLSFPWDLQAYPLTAYKQRKSLKGKPYRKVPLVIHMRQGPAKMEFCYGVNGEKRGLADSIEFQELHLDHARGDADEDGEDDGTLFDAHPSC